MAEPGPTGCKTRHEIASKALNRLEIIEQIGRKVTSILDLDEVLAAIVDAAVDLSEAKKGSLLLVDETNTELFIKASRNFQEIFVQTFRLPIQDSLAGQVVRSGKPIVIEKKGPGRLNPISCIPWSICRLPSMSVSSA